jgi:hypothetical protein
VASTGGERARSTGTDLVERVHDTLIPTVAALLESARESTADVAAQTDSAVGSAVASAEDVAARAVNATTNVVRDTFATLFWLAAAAAVIYFALLSPERRERVKRLLYGGLEQARLLMRDFQGYEDAL